jgi:hypothetical protein
MQAESFTGEYFKGVKVLNHIIKVYVELILFP